MNTLKLNTIVSVNNLLGRVEEVLERKLFDENHNERNAVLYIIRFMDGLTTLVDSEDLELKVLEGEKRKYSKEEQISMIGFVFSVGFILIHSYDFGIRFKSAKYHYLIEQQ